MKRKNVLCLLFLASALFSLGFWRAYESGTVCSQPSGTRIIGRDNTGGSIQTLSAGDMRIYLCTADYSCPVSELLARIYGSFTAGEYITLGLYTSSGSKLQDGSGIEGDGIYGYKSDMLDLAVQLAQGAQYILAIHTSADIQITYEVPGDTNQKYKTISGHTYTHGTLPETIDVTGMTDDRQQHIYGVNP